jgi:hypothetical protein
MRHLDMRKVAFALLLGVVYATVEADDSGTVRIVVPMGPIGAHVEIYLLPEGVES